jgi:hypothetical protein
VLRALRSMDSDARGLESGHEAQRHEAPVRRVRRARPGRWTRSPRAHHEAPVDVSDARGLDAGHEGPSAHLREKRAIFRLIRPA